MNHIAVIGEAVADAFLPSGQAGTGVLNLRVRPGGSPVNTAVGLSRLGTPTTFLGRLATGPLGDLIRDHLAGSKVDLSAAVAAPEPATLAIASLDPSGRAAYAFYADGTADWQWTPDELARLDPGGVRCVHAGSMALARDPGGPLIETLLGAAREAGATVSIDPNVRPSFVAPDLYRERLGRWTSLADLFRLSDEDLEHLWPGAAPERACDAFHRDGVRLVVVTLGARGALASLDGARVTVPAPPIDPVDTVGAGDAFNAGLLHWLDEHGRLGGRLPDLTLDEVERAVEFAVQNAARTCLVPGADPPWRGDV
ncbi:carbohydrate kinase [Actinomadura sp. SCN-SB]|uniref:carbohydrate kinase family protein n=1 Tax=Actinomadura sp. SCN-SB TaxID=3373092 RepID=UPI003752D217